MMQGKFLVFFLLVGLLSCNKEDLPKGTKYEVNFKGVWSEEAYPQDYPDNAHFSRPVGMTHSSGTRFFTINTLASEGVKVMAETGDVAPLDSEIQQLIDNGDAWDLIVGERLETGTSESTFTISANDENSLVTLVSMVAPSPDWFVAVENIPLKINGEWIESVTVNAITYDAGTDSGATFKSENLVTNPATPIFIPTDAPIGDGIEPFIFATFTFNRK